LKSKLQIETIIEKIKYGKCPSCVADENIFCNRDCDAKCLECGKAFCLGHIIQHGESIHFMSSNNDHCTKEIKNNGL